MGSFVCASIGTPGLSTYMILYEEFVVCCCQENEFYI